ncbi:MAG: RluA family pseudouridine synthase, partial [Anaerovoracaceae bacterium]
MRDFIYIVTKEDAQKELPIRELLRQNFSFSSRLRTKLKKHKSVYLNGESVPGWITPKAGDEIKIFIPEEQSHFPPEPIPIDPVFEDTDLLIINKQPGVIVHPTSGHPIHTIANGVTQYMIDTNQSFKIRFVNRLDMDTSGLLVLGKNSHAQDDYVKQMQKNQVEKRYVAIVKGIIEEDGTVDAPLGRPDPERVQRGVMEGGKPSITHYKVLERFDKGYTMVELLLETGRTHQIRVHMSHIGHPIVGDHLYGGENINLIGRQAL